MSEQPRNHIVKCTLETMVQTKMTLGRLVTMDKIDDVINGEQVFLTVKLTPEEAASVKKLGLDISLDNPVEMI
jgi:hypothetical protein